MRIVLYASIILSFAVGLNECQLSQIGGHLSQIGSQITQLGSQLFSECDQLAAQGVTTCLQFFNPTKFVRDVIGGNRESLCCTHFKHDACIRGVHEAIKVAKSTNICPETFSDTIISTLSESSVGELIRSSCSSFDSSKCIMDSVGDVVNKIRGFFTSSQTQSMIRGTIDNIFNIGNNNNGNNRPSIVKPLTDIINRPSTVESPVAVNPISSITNNNNKRGYIPEESLVRSVQAVFNTKTSTTEGPLVKSLFDNVFNQRSKSAQDSTLLDSFNKIFDTNDNIENPSILQSVGDIFTTNGTNESPSLFQSIGNIFN